MRQIRKQKGFIVSAELILIATILVIGLIVGLQGVRVAVVTELADVGEAIGELSQTYSYSGVVGHHATTNGTQWIDAPDSCELGTGAQSGVNSRCVAVCLDPVLGEGPTPPTP